MRGRIQKLTTPRATPQHSAFVSCLTLWVTPLGLKGIPGDALKGKTVEKLRRLRTYSIDHTMLEAARAAAGEVRDVCRNAN